MAEGVQVQRVAVQDLQVEDEILFLPDGPGFIPDSNGDRVLCFGVVTEMTNGRDDQNRMVIHLKVYSDDETVKLTLVRGYDLVEKVIK